MQIDPHQTDTPRARLANDKVWSLVQLLSEAIEHPDPSPPPHDGCRIAAVSAHVLAAPHCAPGPGGGLAPWQLRRVIDHMEAQFPQRIELATLAARINLSQAHFSRAFKASTGMAPYQWQLNARIRRGQTMLSGSDATLADIAHATGFADPVHFGRMFRKHVGVSPGAWRSERKR